jgi:hypothetical protein
VVAPGRVGVVAGLVAKDVLQKLRSHPSKIKSETQKKDPAKIHQGYPKFCFASVKEIQRFNDTFMDK